MRSCESTLAKKRVEKALLAPEQAWLLWPKSHWMLSRATKTCSQSINNAPFSFYVHIYTLYILHARSPFPHTILGRWNESKRGRSSIMASLLNFLYNIGSTYNRMRRVRDRSGWWSTLDKEKCELFLFYPKLYPLY